MGRVQMHGIGSRKLVYKEVVEVQSNSKNFTSGDLGILFVLIQLGVTGLKQTSSYIS